MASILKTSCNRALYREAFYQAAKLKQSEGLYSNIAYFIQGGDIKARTPGNDVDLSFRQESNFYYLTGLSEPGCCLLLNPSKSESVLFVPEYDDEYALWCGDYPVIEDYKQKLGFSRVEYKTQGSTLVSSILNEWQTHKVIAFDQESKSNQLIQQLSNVEVVGDEITRAFYVLVRDLRLIKQQEEIEMMRKMCQISGDAHVKCMQRSRPGINERELEAVFRYETMINAGSVFMAYDPIIAGDDRGATLHYVRNDENVSDGSLVLIDAGAECYGSLYASDITRVFPVNGKFSEKQRQVYQIVLDAQMAVLNSMKPGVKWEDMHRLASRVITKGLFELGLLKVDGKSGEEAVDELVQNHVGAVFFPHGLGHALGLDVHDPPNRDGSFEKIDEPGIGYLRLRVTLQKGMVLTVEPGIYFNKRMIANAFKNETTAKYLNATLIDEYMCVGGIRIEDDVAITDDGIDNLCAGVPKTIDEIEKIMTK
ncbi:aminopeptidase [Naegleria gruberi]|uniref:Aminopeptidase n=1 Tax=Naegleria gruberi TaxID=5762 RepID=D2V2Q0_NAEGR|nr:aminopeptidase [Naegleria gruberi]EFC48933.1 aminopeptidase [Naegleria gruberi]|eukprot:XP_002681677.1 aminopeptidase [Naegleria gruberi]